MEITRFNICTDPFIIYKKYFDILLWPCTNGTDTVTRGREEQVRIIDRRINIRSPHPRRFEL